MIKQDFIQEESFLKQSVLHLKSIYVDMPKNALKKEKKEELDWTEKYFQHPLIYKVWTCFYKT